MTWGLFEISDAYQKNEILLITDVTQLKENLKIQTYEVEDVNKHKETT